MEWTVYMTHAYLTEEIEQLTKAAARTVFPRLKRAYLMAATKDSEDLINLEREFPVLELLWRC